MFAVPSFFGYNTTFVSTPVATAATGVGETSFTANWNAFVGAQYYLLDVSTSPSFSSFVFQNQVVLAPTTSYVVIGLTASTTYYYRLRASTDPYFDPDAAAFFARVTAAGGTLTTTEQNATNQLVLDMKSAGIWTAMRAVYPMVGASAAACAQNLKSSSFTGSFSSGWTFASTGVTPNGTSAFMDTSLIPNTNISSQNSISFGYYSNSNMTSPSTEMGCANAGLGNGTYLIVNVGGSSYNRVTSNSSQAFASTFTTGFYQLSRIVSTEFKYYKNSSILNTATITSSGLSTNNFWGAGGVNYGGTSEYGGGQCAFSFIGDGLTDTQASDFYTAVQIFNQTLSRSVGPQIVSDADAQAYINRVYTAGGTLTNTEASAVNQLVIDMKGAGIWTAMRAVYPMVGASAAACAQNLKSSSFTGSFTSGWTFESSGVNGNGVSAYFNTTFNPNTQLTFTDSHISLYKNLGTISAVDKANGVYDIGANTIDFSLNPDRNTTSYSQGGIGSYSPDSSVGGSSSVQGNGFYVVARNANNFIRLTKNNTNTLTNTTTSSPASVPNDNIWLGASHQVGQTAVVVPNNYRYAFMSMGNYLDATQASDFYTAVQIFNTTLGRQVAG